MGWCRECLSIHPDGEHLKQFYVWCLDRETYESKEEVTAWSRRVRARTHREAAERWADLDDSNSCEYSIIGGEEVEVNVLAVEDRLPEDVKIFRVVGEHVRVYNATEL